MGEYDSEDCCWGAVGGADRAVVVGVRGPPGPAVGGGCARFCSGVSPAQVSVWWLAPRGRPQPGAATWRGPARVAGRQRGASGPLALVAAMPTVRARLVAQGAGDLDVELHGPVPTGAQVGAVSHPTAGALAWKARAMTGVRAGIAPWAGTSRPWTSEAPGAG